MPTREVDLTDHNDEFVDEQIASGRFRDASEVLRAGLHLLEQQTRQEQKKLELLRALADEGFRELDRGEGIEIGGDEELREFIEQIGRRVAKRRRRGA